MRTLRGGIDKTTNGRFRVRIRKRTVGIYDTREEAERIRIASLEVLASEEGPAGETVREFGGHVLTARELGHKVRDPATDWGRWRMHVVDDPIARVAVGALRPDHVESWLERLEERGLAPQTRRNCLNLLRVVLRRAVKKRLAKTNVAVGVRVEGKSPDAWTYLRLEEQRALCAAFSPPERHIVEFAIGTGLRAGELVTLRLVDLHAEGTSPHVIVRYGRKPNKPPKNGKVRSVPLFGMGLASARAWLAELPQFAPINPTGLAFPRQRGSFRNHDHVLPWDRWKGALASAGITRRVRWHDLRHTCASSLVSGLWGRRWSLEEVREMLGHSSIVVTQRYAHLAESAITRAAAETPGASPEPPNMQVPGNTESSRDFLNRWSHVRLVSGAHLRNHSEIRDSARTPRDTALALLRAMAAGDPNAGRLAVELATAVLDEPAESACASRPGR